MSTSSPLLSTTAPDAAALPADAQVGEATRVVAPDTAASPSAGATDADRTDADRTAVNAPDAELLLVDSHVHLDQMSEAQAAWAFERGARGRYRALIPGINPPQWQGALARFEDDAWVDLALGLHPWTAEDGAPPIEDREWLPELEAALASPRVFALGEVGLDAARWRESATRAQGEAIFVKQLALARRFDLPLVLHVVRAHARAVELLKVHGAGLRGVVHAFTGSLEEFRAYERLGFLVSIGAAVTDPRRARVQALVAALPPEGWLLETDGPFMPIAGASVEGGADGIVRVLATVASLRGEPAAELAARSAAQHAALFPARR